MEALAQDISLALRALSRRPGLTLAALLSLAVGLGSALAIYRLVSAAFLRPLGVGEPASVVAVYVARRARADDYLPVSLPNFADLAAGQRSLSSFAAYQWLRTTLGDGDGAKRSYIQIVPRAFFDALGAAPAMGRLWSTAEDSNAGASPVAVLSHDFWRRELGSDPEVVGKTVRVGGQLLAVVAVMPPGFKGTRTFTGAELWVPMGLYGRLSPYAGEVHKRGAQMFEMVGRLAPGVSLPAAELDLQALAERLAADHPDANRDLGIRVLPLAEAAIEPWQRPLFVRAGLALSGVVGLLLLGACGNVASLLLARGLEQRREIAVRLALGAGRGPIVRQLLAQSLLLALAGGALGLLLGHWAPGFLWRFRPLDLFTADALDFSLDGRMLWFACGLSLATGLLFGLAPALQALRPQLAPALQQESATVFGARSFAFRDLLVAGQVAMCFLTLAGAGLFIKSLERAQRVGPGFDADRLLVMSYSLGSDGTGTLEAESLNQRALEGLSGLPGVERVALASFQPLTAGPPVYWRIEPQGEPPAEGPPQRLVMTNAVSPGYFATLGIPLLAGRDFGAADRPGAPAITVVNAVLAKRLWATRDPLGRRLYVAENDSLLEVVGVVAASKHHSVTEAPRSGLYLPLAQWPRSELTLHLRTAGDPRELIEPARRRLEAVAPALAPYGAQPMRRTVEASLWAQRLGAALLGLFAAVALVLAVTGVHAVLSYSVRQRFREMGIRLALGAPPAAVLRLVLRRAMVPVGAGILVGLLVAVAAGRFVASLLFGIQPSDPLTLAEITALVAVVALAAGYGAARRATRVDPREALRCE